MSDLLRTGAAAAALARIANFEEEAAALIEETGLLSAVPLPEDCEIAALGPAFHRRELIDEEGRPEKIVYSFIDPGGSVHTSRFDAFATMCGLGPPSRGVRLNADELGRQQR